MWVTKIYGWHGECLQNASFIPSVLKLHYLDFFFFSSLYCFPICNLLAGFLFLLDCYKIVFIFFFIWSLKPKQNFFVVVFLLGKVALLSPALLFLPFLGPIRKDSIYCFIHLPQ